MKINPVGIQGYQQVPNKTEQAKPGEAAKKNAVDTKVTIEPQQTQVGSKLAIRAGKGDYSQSLTTEERQALELLFSRFKDTGRFTMNGKPEADGSDAGLGQLIDVKI